MADKIKHVSGYVCALISLRFNAMKKETDDYKSIDERLMEFKESNKSHLLPEILFLMGITTILAFLVSIVSKS